ncbi:hypothetical protein [Jiangella endophytica]|uniref:hypothetical protein n=1 Tax=Jiangella endophytica TaxID=1623398 RepID=UPI000E35685A|nr:hypothetical protein [Jiangella endophytica]
MSKTLTWTVAVVAAVALVGTACSSSSDDDDGGSVPSGAADPSGTTEAPPSGRYGVPETPLPVGEPIAFERWTLTVGPSEQREGSADPARPDLGGPEAGWTYMVAEFDLVSTYQQGQALEAFGGLEFTVQGASGERYTQPCVPDNPMNMSTFLPATVQQIANVCVEVPLDDVDGAVWRIGQRGVGEDAYVALS